MKKRVGILIFSIFLAFLLSIVLEKAADYFLNKYGYFTAMTPNLREVQDNIEFHVESYTSSQGIRNEEVAIPKPKGTFRILALGDSFTYGFGVSLSDSWVKKLERQLRQKGLKVEVINAGKPGASPTDIRRICKAYKNRFEIDAFIVGSYYDDLVQAGYREQTLEEHPLTAYIQETWPVLVRLNRRVISYNRYKNAHVGEYIETSKEARAVVQQLLKKTATVLLKVPPKFRKPFLEGKINPAVITTAIAHPDFFNFVLRPDALQLSLAAYRIRLDKLKDECTKDLPALIVLFPSSEFVSEKYQGLKKELGYNTNPAVATFDIDRYLKPVVEGNGYFYYSPLPDFRKDGCENCYYPYDGHLSKEGNARVAKNIDPLVEKYLLHLK